MAWQSKNGNDGDPRRQTSVPLVGHRLAGEPDHAKQFLMFEFIVCAPGEHLIESIDILYTEGLITYYQTIKVHYTVERALPSDKPCP